MWLSRGARASQFTARRASKPDVVFRRERLCPGPTVVLLLQNKAAPVSLSPIRPVACTVPMPGYTIWLRAVTGERSTGLSRPSWLSLRFARAVQQPAAAAIHVLAIYRGAYRRPGGDCAHTPPGPPRDHAGAYHAFTPTLFCMHWAVCRLRAAVRESKHWRPASSGYLLITLLLSLQLNV